MQSILNRAWSTRLKRVAVLGAAIGLAATGAGVIATNTNAFAADAAPVTTGVTGATI